MKKLLISMFTLVAILTVFGGASIAYFTDTEVSVGNIFTTGRVNLQVESKCAYFQNNQDVGCTDGDWTMTNLTAEKFFNFDDVKPGDSGSTTVGLRVRSNDAWGRLVIGNIVDREIRCNDAELVAEPGCNDDEVGELRENIMFYVWLDDGLIPGFQGSALDPEEGNNVWDAGEMLVVSPGAISASGETHMIHQALMAAYAADGAVPGITSDGRMVNDVVYYFGLGWELPSSVGNEVQLDSFSASMTFDVTQHRNNSGMVF